MKRFAIAMGLVLGTAACGQGDDASVGPGDEQDYTKQGASTLACSVGKGVDEHDDAAKITFKVSGLGTAKATFVKTGWRVENKAGKELTSDGEAMSVVA